MEAGVADHVWSLEEVVALLDQQAVKSDQPGDWKNSPAINVARVVVYVAVPLFVGIEGHDYLFTTIGCFGLLALAIILFVKIFSKKSK
jgi:hypothetical protein